MRRFFRILSVILTACCGLIFGAVGYLQAALPDSFTVSEGEKFHIGRLVQSEQAADTVTTAIVQSGEEYRTELRLAGLIPLKEVTVSVTDTPVVMVCGTPFGIKLYTDGVLIVGMSDVMTAAGAANPAAAAGVCVGDTILSINGQAVSTNREVSRQINACDGKPVTLPDTNAAEALGIATIHQELNLVGSMSVAENICLGRMPRKFGLVDRRAMKSRARAALNLIGTILCLALGIALYYLGMLHEHFTIRDFWHIRVPG
jgi:hypothetical protein